MTVGSTGDSGGCSLRSVIEAVEANTSNGCGTVESPTTTINVPANTITLSSQLVVNHGHMAIVGDESNPTQTVIEGGADRVMEIKSGAVVELAGLEITGGHTPDGGIAPSLYTENVVGNGGGILNKGSLTLKHAVVTENQTGKGDLGLNGPLEGAGGSGGRGGSGGGIFNEPGASLTIRQSTISKNLTGDGGKGGEGGAGVNAIGHFPNGGDGGRGGASGDGGGLYNAGTLVIEGSTISGNFTGRGGEGGTGSVGTGEVNEFSPGRGGDGGEGGNSGVQYEKNAGYNSDLLDGGGGIYNAGSLTMTNSTISGNGTGAGGAGGGSGAGGGPSKYGRFADSGHAGTGGGGGRGGGLFTGGGSLGQSPVHLTNVTIYGNRTGDGGPGGPGGGGEESTLGGGVGGWGGDGGGIWSQGAKSGSEVILTNVTIAGNGVGAGGLTGSSAVPNRGGCCGERGLGAGLSTGGDYSSGSAIFEKNSIIAGNGDPLAGDTNCHQRYLPSSNDFYDFGGNLTYPGNGHKRKNSEEIDPNFACLGRVADPLLAALANNGGPTETMLPGAGSAAIELVPAASCTAEDQRGFSRPGPGKAKCDSGAVETGLHASGGEEETLALTITGSGQVKCKANGGAEEPCASEYGKGTPLTLVPKANAHFVFSGWSGASGSASSCTGTGNCSFTLEANSAVTAHFAQVKRTLTINLAGSGSGHLKCELGGGPAVDDPCASEYADGTQLKLIPVAGSGSLFVGFSAGSGAAAGCVGSSPCTIVIEGGNAAISARFDPEPMGTGPAPGTQPGGGNPGGGSPGGGSTGGTGTTPKPKPLTCRKGFKKKAVNGKPKCVRKHKAHKKHHH
jgi:hypothetical protein